MQAAAAFLVNIDGILDAALDLATSRVSCCLSWPSRLPFMILNHQWLGGEDDCNLLHPVPLMRRAQLLPQLAYPPPVTQCCIFLASGCVPWAHVMVIELGIWLVI